jgi:hypothetical protein
MKWELKIITMKKHLLTTALLIFVVLQGYAQRFDYENTSKIFFGLNIGSVWHTSDVENAKERFPLGAGFVFGGSMNQNYGNAISFDIRFRYLGGTWYGKDSDTTSAIQNNYAVQPLYDTLGYTVQNFRAAQHRFALELSMHANRFKERTGFDPYIFGGIGFTASTTKGDLLKSTGGVDEQGIYPYDQTQNGSIIDEKYETLLDINKAGDAYTKDAFDVKVLPSLGVGIGYYFNNRFSMGIEHKTTFVMDDYFDGTTVNQDGQQSDLFKNDLYHYTSIYFKWYLRGSKNTYTHPVDNPPIDPQPQNPDIDPVRRDKPIVDFSNPQDTPHRTNAPTFDLRANVRNVSSADYITFTQNQNRSTSFNFNPQSNVFQANARLVPGLNTFFIKGENQFGKARDLVEIYYDVEVRENPPIVKITNPSANPYIINQLTYNLKADIRNIKARNQITVTFNGQNVSNFNFSETGSNNFSIPLNLRGGTNTIRIEARNNFGMDSDETVIIYERENIGNTGFPPVVNILIPNANPYMTSQLNENIVAKVENIIAKQNIEVRINGLQTSSFSFNNTNGRVQFNAGLNAGTNTIRISANNEFGNTFDETQIIYRRGEQGNNLPPIVDILTPSTSPYTTVQSYENITASINNIESKQQVEVRVNGVLTNNYAFNRLQNSTTHQVQFNAVLNLGSNTIRISASNNFGNDFDETQIIYRKKVESTPPTVQIITPNVNPFTTNQASETIVANTNFVTTKQQVGVLVNGVQTNNFTFYNGIIQLTAGLNAGSNTIRISVNNTFGNDFDETQIIYRKKVESTPPTVQIITPNVNPITTNQASETVVANTNFITTKQQVGVLVNGVQTNNFTFYNGTIQLTAGLNVGTNTIRISVNNTFGNDFDETTIIYKKKENSTPPTVLIITPNVNPITTNQTSETIVANTNFVTTKQQVEVRVNGVQTNNFTFYNGTIQLTAGLNAGSNTIRISVNNPFGNDFDETQIIFSNGGTQTGKIPTVDILTPSVNPFTTTQISENIVARVDNINNVQQIEVLINGVSTNSFILEAATSNVLFSAGLNPGTNTVRVLATNNYGNAFDETTIIYRKKADPKPPVVTFMSPSAGQKSVILAEFKMIAQVENITSKNDVEVFFNGTVVNPNDYNFNTQLKTVNYLSNLKFGINNFIVKATNADGNHQATRKIERGRKIIEEAEPCIKPVMRNTAPKNEFTKLVKNQFTVRGYLENINKYNQIEVFINGSKMDGYTFNETSKSFTHPIKLYEAKSVYLIKLTNECGTTEKQFIFMYESVEICGVDIEMINASSEFCLITPTGTVLSGDLISNKNFNYKGKASSLYFKANKNGKAIVNGKTYNLVNGNYYHFAGIITVDISKNKSGSNGKWNVCVESVRTPLSGKGSTKPQNPCAKPEITKPEIVKPRPNVREKPETGKPNFEKPNTRSKPNTRQKPTINTEGSEGGATTPNTENNKIVVPRRRGAI